MPAPGSAAALFGLPGALGACATSDAFALRNDADPPRELDVNGGSMSMIEWSLLETVLAVHAGCARYERDAGAKFRSETTDALQRLVARLQADGRYHEAPPTAVGGGLVFRWPRRVPSVWVQWTDSAQYAMSLCWRYREFTERRAVPEAAAIDVLLDVLHRAANAHAPGTGPGEVLDAKTARPMAAWQ